FHRKGSLDYHFYLLPSGHSDDGFRNLYISKLGHDRRQCFSYAAASASHNLLKFASCQIHIWKQQCQTSQGKNNDQHHFLLFFVQIKVLHSSPFFPMSSQLKSSPQSGTNIRSV